MYAVRKFLKFALVVALMVVAASCVDINDIEITSFKINSVIPKGLKSVSGTVSVGVNNGTKGFTISDIEGTIYRNGTDIGTFTADPVTVEAKTSATYKVTGVLNLNSNISVLEILALAADFNAEEFTVSVSAKFDVKGGVSKRVELEKVPVKKVLSRVKS